MASNRLRARGLTLIEVLLAVVLLAALAAVSIGIFRDASAATEEVSQTNSTDELARQAHLLVGEHSEPLGKLAVGQSWRPPPEATDIAVVVTREPCEDCPEGWARLKIAGEAVSLARFHKIDPRTEQDQ